MRYYTAPLSGSDWEQEKRIRFYVERGGLLSLSYRDDGDAFQRCARLSGRTCALMVAQKLENEFDDLDDARRNMIATVDYLMSRASRHMLRVETVILNIDSHSGRISIKYLAEAARLAREQCPHSDIIVWNGGCYLVRSSGKDCNEPIPVVMNDWASICNRIIYCLIPSEVGDADKATFRARQFYSSFHSHLGGKPPRGVLFGVPPLADDLVWETFVAFERCRREDAT